MVMYFEFEYHHSHEFKQGTNGKISRELHNQRSAPAPRARAEERETKKSGHTSRHTGKRPAHVINVILMQNRT